MAFDLSILIVNWNGRDMLANLLRSIGEHSDGLCIQTIVVDNASADGSREMVAREFAGTKLIANDHNAGFARGNNQAAAVAEAPLLLLLNNDTRVRNGALRTLVEYAKAHGGTVAAGPKLIGGDGKPQRSGRNLPTFWALLHTIQFLKWTGLFRSAYRRYRRGNFDPEVSGPVQQLAAAALLLRADAFNDCGRFDEGYEFGVEDVDLCARLGRRGAIAFVSEAAIDHLGRISSRANRPFVYRAYECGWARYLARHHGRGAAACYKILVTMDMPVRVGALSTQWIVQTVLGRGEKAQRTAGVLAAATSFMCTGLWKFWRA